jgi:hypothetical protein
MSGEMFSASIETPHFINPVLDRRLTPEISLCLEESPLSTWGRGLWWGRVTMQLCSARL